MKIKMVRNDSTMHKKREIHAVNKALVTKLINCRDTAAHVRDTNHHVVPKSSQLQTVLFRPGCLISAAQHIYP